jgi:uncharacterized protein YecT (DUF1311 family)
MKNTILAFFFILLCFGAFAQENADAKHPIEVKMDKCIENDGSTGGMNECMATATAEWDKELNKYYKLLQGKVSPEQKAVLQDVQRSWIAFKDKEIKLINIMYGEMDGTMWTNVASSRVMQITKERALDIKSLYEDVAGQ